MEQRLDTAAQAIASRMVDLITTAYPPASRPGEPPHSRTGTLARSIHYRRPAPLQRQIGSEVFYAKMLESGTRRMDPRPYMLRALMESTGEIKTALTQNANALAATGH